MYSLIRSLTARQMLFQQLPALGGSFLIAELFYKFGSFGLEALAFLGTWLVLDAVIQTLAGVVARAEAGAATPAGVGGSGGGARTGGEPRLSVGRADGAEDSTRATDADRSDEGAGDGGADPRPGRDER
jgi:hypothetical protein